MKPRRRIIGIDPGTIVAGFAIADHDCDSGKNLELLDCGKIAVEGSRPFRLNWLREELDRLFAKWATERVDVCVEMPWVGKNPQTALIVGEAHGVVLAAAGSLRRARFFDYPVFQIRASVGGNKKADKYLTAQVVRSIFRIPESRDLPLDATDAAAVVAHHYLQGNKLHPWEREG